VLAVTLPTPRDVIAPARPCVFFTHVMKTGGMSFVTALEAETPAGRYWLERGPEHRFDQYAIYTSVHALAEFLASERHQVSVMSGHLPHAAGALLGENRIDVTLLRSPVDRTLSYLQHCQRHHHEHREHPLEEIYEDEWFRDRFMQNHQTKVFSMRLEEALDRTQIREFWLEQIDERLAGADPGLVREAKGAIAADDLLGLMRTLDLLGIDPSSLARTSRAALILTDTALARSVPDDDARLDDAKRALEGVDIIGVTEQYQRFIERVNDELGLSVAVEQPLNTTDEIVKVSSSFRRRIADDNQRDLELYSHVRDRLV
jgi:hypothetical protein